MDSLIGLALIEQNAANKGKLPTLRRSYTKLEGWWFGLSFILIFFFLIGLIPFIAFYIWYYGLEKRLRIVNVASHEKFFMTKDDWKKYKKIKKDRSYRTVSVEDIVSGSSVSETTSVDLDNTQTSDVISSTSTSTTSTSDAKKTDNTVANTFSTKAIPVSQPTTYSEKRASMRLPVAGLSKYHQTEFNKLVKSCFENSSMSIPYDDMSNSEIRSNYEDLGIDDPVFQIPRDLDLGELKFIPEPDNQYNKNAIKIILENAGVQTLIGYVPDSKLERATKFIDNPKYEVKYRLTGGKYKIALDDELEDKVNVRVQGQDNPFYLQIKFYKKD